MSFGWSAGDIVQAINLALKVYNNYRSSYGDFHALTQEVVRFKSVLQEVHKTFKPIDLDIQQKKSLGVLGKQSVALLNDLDKFLQKNVHPDTGKLTPSKRLLWRASDAEKLRKRMLDLTAYWSTYQNAIINDAIHKNGCAILELLTKPDPLSEAQRDILFEEPPSLTGLRAALTAQIDTAWPNPAARRIETEPKTIGNNDGEEDIAYELHGATLVDPEYSPTSSLVEHVLTGSSGTTSSSAERKKSFLDTRRPKEPPLAMNLGRKKRTESSSNASLKSEDKDPPPQRRASTSFLKSFKPGVLGSSAPSMYQQRLPFGPGHVSLSRPPKSIP